MLITYEQTFSFYTETLEEGKIIFFAIILN